MLHIVVRDVQKLSGKQEDDKKRNMQKVAKGNKTRKKLRHDMMNQKYGSESGLVFGLEEFETAKRCKNGFGPNLPQPLRESKSC